jgi:uncharacterized repeat protein (TIGR01451 family)/LPXTG-motif cell wall-anchored protein
MRASRYTPAPWAFLLLGFLLLLAGLGGSWGVVHGQTAGPTPTITGGQIVVRKRVDRNTANPGETVTFSIQVTNETQQTQTVTVRDPITGIFEVVSVTTTMGTARAEGQLVIVEVGAMAPGETATITIVTRVRAGTTPQQVANIAEVVTVEMDPNAPPIKSDPVPVGISVPAPAGLPNTGDAQGPVWPLLFAGGLLLLAGALMLARRGARG